MLAKDVSLCKAAVMRYFILFVFIALLVLSCSKDKDAPAPAVVRTDSVGNITETSANVYGFVLSEGEGGGVYRRGARWGLGEYAFVNVAYSAVDTLGAFSVAITGLEPKTDYLVYAFIEDGNGVISAAGRTIGFRTK